MNLIDTVRLEPEARHVAPRAFRRAVSVIDSCSLVAHADAALSGGPGRPSALTVRAFCILGLLTATEFDGRQFLTNAARIGHGLSRAQRAELGLTGVKYHDLARALATITSATEERVNPKTGEVRDARLPFTLHDLSNALVRTTVPAGLVPSNTVTVDSTDVETWAARKSLSTLSDTSEDAKPRPDGAFPRLGSDGRPQHSLDADARDGFRSGKQMQHRNIFHGYDLHLVTDVRPLGDPEQRPPFVRSLTMTPANSSKPAAGLRAITEYDQHVAPVSTVIADRGYTTAKATKWAIPLAARLIEQVLDLHPNERGAAPGPTPGTLFIDGALFSSALPRRLRDLKRLPHYANAGDKARNAQQFDQREPYAFTPFGPRRTDGSRRYRGPALTGRLRCPNVPKSMLNGHHVPISPCAPGKPCGCGTTVTLGTDSIKHRQRLLYGTTKWVASYGRRVAVESANANVRQHHANITRGSIRVTGLPKTFLMATFQIMAANLRLAASRYDTSVDTVTGQDVLTPKPPLRKITPAFHVRAFRPPPRPPIPLGQPITANRRTDHD